MLTARKMRTISTTFLRFSIQAFLLTVSPSQPDQGP